MRTLLKRTTAFLAFGVMAGFAGGAMAADVVEASPVDYSWSGIYIGGYVGAGAQVTHTEIAVSIAEFDIDGHGDDGFLAGALLGYNWQVSDRFVIGLQGDIAFPDMDVTLLLGDFGPDFIASASLRAGLLVTSDTLLYAIGGYSYGEFDIEPEAGDGIDNEAFDGFHVGAGMETRLTDRLTARIEYRYTAFGKEEPVDGAVDELFFEVTPHIHTGTIGLAYNLFPTAGEGMEATPAADVVEPVVDWTGLYLGINGGAGAVVSRGTILSGEPQDVGGEGFLGSLMAGFNWQAGERFVVGLQGDVGLADMDWSVFVGSSNPVASVDVKDKLNWFASASLRAGWLPSPETMIYVIGGYSYAEFEMEVDFVSGVLSAQDSVKEDLDGYHIGAGIESMLTDNLTARIEYRYTDYGRGRFALLDDFDLPATEFDHATHTGTIGIAWLFGGL